MEETIKKLRQIEMEAARICSAAAGAGSELRMKRKNHELFSPERMGRHVKRTRAYFKNLDEMMSKLPDPEEVPK